MPTIHPKFRSASSWLTPIILLLWGAGISYGIIRLVDYHSAPSDLGNAPVVWPDQSLLELSSTRQTLLMFVHPKCPCTLASVNELEKLLTRRGKHVDTKIIFSSSKDRKSDFHLGPVWNACQNLSEVDCYIDQDGSQSELFQMKSSGHVLLYDPQGKLLFNGGITSSRGHEGDNNSTYALLDLTQGKTSNEYCNSVYGCPLYKQPNSQVK